MSVVKIIEVLSESEVSWEDAAKKAIAKAGKTVRGIKSIYIKDHSASVAENKITAYRITAKISFLLD